MQRLIDKVEFELNSGCWLWSGALHTGGYGLIKVNGRTERAHRVSYETFRGAIPAGLRACHRCDTPACVNPGHLFLGTDADNVADRVRKGRGDDKLTPASVIEIRRRLANGDTQAQIARDLGVTATIIWHVKSGRTWAHVREEVN